MVCIYCGGDTQVTNSRPQKRLNHIWRRRKCLNCEAIFSTSEAPDLAASWRILKSTGLEPFSRDNLFLSLYDSLRHRKTAQSDATALTDTIVSNVTHHISNGQLERNQLTSEATEVLKRFDNVAATHYAAFHPL